jgi:chemotaxis protein histidine kinase CheA
MRSPSGRSLTVTAVVPDQAAANLHDCAVLPPYPGKIDGQVQVEAAIEAGQQAQVAAQAAEASAIAAADSEANAAASESNAASSETVAVDSAALAQAWATKTDAEVVPGQGYGAKKYALDAAAAEAIATAKASDASASEANATAAASTAVTRAGVATARAAEAATSASNASASASTATTQAGIASGAASAASASASSASGAAGAAGFSASLASTKAGEAAAHAAAAAQTFVPQNYVPRAGGVNITGDLNFDGGYIGSLPQMNGHPSHNGANALNSPLFRNPVANGNTMVGAIANGSGGRAGFYGRLVSSVRWGGLFVDDGGVHIHSSASHNAVTAAPIHFTFKGVTKAFFTNDGGLGCHGVRFMEGVNGSNFGNVINLWWTGTALQAWVDTSNIGTVTITSDYRIKRDIRTMEQSALARVAALRPVTYRYADNAALHSKADDRLREGFVAHELAEVIPSAVEGEKDAPNQIQSLRVDALVAVLVKAVQEQQVQISELRERLGME